MDFLPLTYPWVRNQMVKDFCSLTYLQVGQMASWHLDDQTWNHIVTARQYNPLNLPLLLFSWFSYLPSTISQSMKRSLLNLCCFTIFVFETSYCNNLYFRTLICRSYLYCKPMCGCVVLYPDFVVKMVSSRSFNSGHSTDYQIYMGSSAYLLLVLGMAAIVLDI